MSYFEHTVEGSEGLATIEHISFLRLVPLQRASFLLLHFGACLSRGLAFSLPQHVLKLSFRVSGRAQLLTQGPGVMHSVSSPTHSPWYRHDLSLFEGLTCAVLYIPYVLLNIPNPWCAGQLVHWLK